MIIILVPVNNVFTHFDRVTSAEVTRCVEQILPDLLSKAGDTTPRVHNLAVHTILSLADAPDVRYGISTLYALSKGMSRRGLGVERLPTLIKMQKGKFGQIGV